MHPQGPDTKTEVQEGAVIVAALYHFTRFEDPASLREPLLSLCKEAKVFGTLLLAHEGINGTIAGPKEGIERLLSHIRALPGCADLEWKISHASEMPFYRMKVRLKKEIVTMGQPDVAPAEKVGRYIEPEDWNETISRDDVVVIDTRNDYEVAIGTFDKAVDPKTDTFRDFPQWWEDNADRFEGKSVAMFCTGGIRCEKATNWLMSQGVEDVMHLKGGILKYLEKIPEQESKWSGECFVFDQRVAVQHGLKEGSYSMCHACRRPISEADKASPDFQKGVSCHHCITEFSEADKARFAERQKQIERAKKEGRPHLGTALPSKR